MAIKQTILLIDPVTEWNRVVQAANEKNLVTIAVFISPIEDRMRKFHPTVKALKESGVDHVLDLQDRDCYNCVHSVQHLMKKSYPRGGCSVEAVVPLSETAVEFSDIVAAMLGNSCHNPLHLTTSRRDKGFMKEAVHQGGKNRVTAFARLDRVEDVRETIHKLNLTYPVVIKTPQGFSTSGVYICQNIIDAETATKTILNRAGPDGRNVESALLEEFIEGTEFAVNLMACKGKLVVTDVWKYVKTESARYSQADICDPLDPSLKHIVEYSQRVAEAVGLDYGAGHVEVKAMRDFKTGLYINPCMVEVGARLSGGRKASMAEAALDGTWDPFAALIDSHSGVTPAFPPSFSPKNFVRHIFLPIEKSGHVSDISLDTSKLTTLHSHFLLVEKGDFVNETTDITSCAGFVWLVGSKDEVEIDTAIVRSSFHIVLTS